MEAWLKNILFESLKIASPSGNEEVVTRLFANTVRQYVDEIIYDYNGNCIAHKKGTGSRVMFMAHADEVGFIITYIDDNGYLYFNNVGCIDSSVLPGQRVHIQGKHDVITGVIGKKQINSQNNTENYNAFCIDDLWIDIGAMDKTDACSMVQVGSMATYATMPSVVSNSYLFSKSLDDKIGVAILMGLAHNLQCISTNCDVYLVASVQEELGARGAQMVSEAILPEVGIAIDVTNATDLPSMSKSINGDVSLGKGVVIPLGPNMNKDINMELFEIAASCNIPYQIEAIAQPTYTDARMIQVAGKGVKTGLISIPCRYIHTPNEMVSLVDVDNAIELLTEFLQRF